MILISNRKVMWTALMAAGFLTGACTKSQVIKKAARLVNRGQQKQVETSPVESNKGQTSSSTDGGDIVAKLNRYTNCINTVSETTYKAADRYFSWIEDPKAGPTCKEKNIYGIYKIDVLPTNPCLENLEKDYATGPRIKDLEAAGTAYAKAVRALIPLSGTVDRYYGQKDYKDDKCKNAKKLHKLLYPQFQAFRKNDQLIRKYLDRESEKRSRTVLADLGKRDGMSLFWHSQNVMLGAKILLDRIKVEMAKTTPDQIAISRACTKFEQTAAAFEQEQKSPKFSQAPKMTYPEYFSSVLLNFTGSVKEFRRIEEWNKKTAQNNKHKYKNLLQSYNYLIDQANRIELTAH